MYEPIEELFKIPKVNFGIMQVYGEKTVIQMCNEFGEVKTISTKTARIQKKQGRGGQSKNRIERLREETVHNYLKLASEKAELVFLSEGQPVIKALLIVGTGIKKDLIREYIHIPVNHYVFACDQESEESLKLFIAKMIESEDENASKKHVKYLTDLLTLNPDLLIFGVEEIKLALENKEVKALYVDEKHSDVFQCDTILVKDSFINAYGCIAEMFYVNPIPYGEDSQSNDGNDSEFEI